MKPTVGLLLLLLAAHHCAAVSQALPGTAPEECCFRFYTRRVPAAKIISITKTHSACFEKAFVIHTAAGKHICVSLSAAWAEEAYNQQELRDE